MSCQYHQRPSGGARLAGSERPERLESTGSPEKHTETAFRTHSRVPKKGGADRIQNGDERSRQVQFQQYLASRDINAEKYSSF